MISFKDKNIATVVSINISRGGIPKSPVPAAEVTFNGLEDDGHHHAKHYDLKQAMSLQDVEELALLRSQGYRLNCGTTGENLDVRFLNVNQLPLGTILNFSGGVQLELSKVRHPCYVLDSIDPRLKNAIMGRCGMYARVLKEGAITAGEKIHVLSPCLTSC